MPDRLLAKSCRPGQVPLPTLAWHTAWVMEAANRLLSLRGPSAMEAAGLDIANLPSMERVVRFAAWWHDTGKCMEHFQRMLRGKGQQPFRHEAVSWYLAVGPLQGFLEAHVPDVIERWMVAACLAGHHRKFTDQASPDCPGPIQDPLGSTILHLDHPDFTEWMRLVPGGLRTPLPNLKATELHAGQIAKAMEDCRILHEDGEPDLEEDQRKALSMAKSMLLAADMAGSAIPKGSSRCEWIDEALGRRASAEERWTLLQAKLQGAPLRPFQEAVADSRDPWTLVKAGCGTGKTAAACAWGAQQHVGRQLWLTYPTTGTATEGYRDYVLEAEVDGALLHSRAELDLELLTAHEDSEENGEVEAMDLALRGWAADTVVSTVDTVLGIVHNQRAGHYAYPGICRGALVFDELHAYDDRLFGCLLRFLEAHPGLPCLFMTASLQSCRTAALDDLCRRLHNRPLHVIPGPEELEILPRYHSLDEDPWEAAATCLGRGGKVLWVSNTVKRAAKVADKAEVRAWSPARYHSRYRYLDRLGRHKEVIDAFKAPGSAFASTTQVAEMSLDLSADLMVTDLAPVPAMIQRLGRLNRRAVNGTHSAPFIVLEPDGTLPYSPDQLQEAREWLARLGAGPLSQRDLALAWTQKDELPSRVGSYWLDESLWTRPGSIREASPGVTVLLEEDLPKVQRHELPACACLIPMPPLKDGLKRLKHQDGFLVAAPNLIVYDPMRGAEWR